MKYNHLLFSKETYLGKYDYKTEYYTEKEGVKNLYIALFREDGQPGCLLKSTTYDSADGDALYLKRTSGDAIDIIAGKDKAFEVKVKYVAKITDRKEVQAYLNRVG